MTDTKRFRDAVKRSGLKYKHIAFELGITPYGLQKKIDNLTEFKASEIVKISEMLRLSEKERANIFFA